MVREGRVRALLAMPADLHASLEAHLRKEEKEGKGEGEGEMLWLFLAGLGRWAEAAEVLRDARGAGTDDVADDVAAARAILCDAAGRVRAGASF